MSKSLSRSNTLTASSASSAVNLLSGNAPAQLGSTSRFRNLFATLINNRNYESLNVSLTSGTNLIRTNGIYYAVPWTRSKGTISPYLGVFNLNNVGKAPPNPYCINTAGQQIIDFDFYPFAKGILATSGRDPIVRIWSHPHWELIADMEVAEAYLAGHEKKIDILKFNPTVADMLLTCSSDLTMKLWDFRTMKEIQTIEGFDEVIMSAGWNYSGNLIGTATRDGFLRYYDPRLNSIHAGIVKTEHSPAKGINICFLGDEEILTTGFNKSGDREMFVWDARKLDQPVTTTRCGNKPGTLTPYYDSTIGLLFVAAKGEGISVYEYSDTKELLTVADCKTEKPQTSVALIPKYVYDLENCEVARFLKLSNENLVQSVSIRVPRKTKASLFQEDLYPPVPINEPGITIDDWGKGKRAAPKLKTMKPEEAISVYDVPPEEGGIARPSKLVLAEEKLKGEAPNMEGFLMIQRKGLFWAAWERKWTWISGNRLHYSDSKDAISSSLSTSLSLVQRVVVSSAEVDPTQVSFQLDLGAQIVSLKAETTEERDRWVKELASMTGAGVISDSPFLTANAHEDRKVNSKFIHRGTIQIYTEGFWGKGKWIDKFLVLEEDVLNVFPDEHSFVHATKEPHESIRLQNVLSVRLTDVNASYETIHEIDESMTVFQMNLPNRVIFFRAPDAQAAMIFVMTLQEASAQAIKKSSSVLANVEAQEIYERFSFSVEGYILKKTSTGFVKMYLTVLGGDFYYFKSHLGMIPTLTFKHANIEGIYPINEGEMFGFKVIAGGNVHIHFASSERLRNWWIRKLNRIQEAQYNLYEKLGIDELLSNEKELDKLERYSESRFIDPLKVKAGTQPLLIMVTGKKNSYAEVVPTTYKSLNGDAVFILDLGGVIFQWNGARTSRVCQARGADVANRIRKQERGGNAVIINVNESIGKTISPFLQELGLKNSTDLAACHDATGDTAEGKGSRKSVLLLKFSDASDSKKRVQIVFNDDERLPSKELLDSDHAYVIDGETELYVWIGSNSGPYVRKLAMLVAKRLLCEDGRAPWTTITKVLENTETVMHKEKFSDYPGELPVHVQPIDTPAGNIAPRMEQPPIDIAEMHREKAEFEEKIDDGSGELTMWLVFQRIKQNGTKEWEKELLGSEFHGHLFTGESFIFQYKYEVKGSAKYVIYFWQGRDSSITEKGASALESIDVANETGGDAKQIRLPQGKETQHFLSLFREALVIHLGKLRAPQKPTQLFQVREKNGGFLVAMEVDDPVLCFNSDFMSFVVHNKKVFFWYGQFCSSKERSYQGVTMFGEQEIKESVKLEEGQETPDFLRICFGKPDGKIDSARKKSPHPRLFLVTGSSGIVVVEEVHKPAQDDLDNDHVLMLDAFNFIYLWFGQNSTPTEKELALEAAQKYVQESPKGHRSSIPLRVTYPFMEPTNFAKQFHGWTFTKFPANKKRTEKAVPLDLVLETFKKTSYSYEFLTGDSVPDHIDRSRLETYLTDDEFKTIFEMPKDQYEKLPEWKKTILKKEKRLY